MYDYLLYRMSSANVLLHYNKICRLCLSPENDLLLIYSDEEDLSFASKIKACVAIEVQPDDILPRKICMKCIEHLDNWEKFKEQCNNSNTLLNQSSAGIVSFSDKILENNIEEYKNECLDISDTSIDFDFVSLLEYESLFQKLEDSSEGLNISDTEVNNLFSGILSNNISPKADNETNCDKRSEETKNTIKSKWKEKYMKIYRKQYNCAVCPRVFSKFGALLHHDKIDHKSIIPNEVCLLCGQLFISKIRLDIHVHMQHNKKLFECDECGVKSVSEKSLKLHKLKHTDKFVCNQCGVVRSSQSSLIDHQHVHNNEREFFCEICLKKFKHRQSLQNHLKTHTIDLKPNFKCDICSKKFTKAEYLKNHKLSHSTEKSSVCEICGALMKNKSTLYIHKLSHKDKNHFCLVCDKSFFTKNLLSRHMFVHIDKPFSCSVCDKFFKRSDTLALHIKSHNASRDFNCNQCNQSFTLNKYLKRHIARIHGKVNICDS